MRYLFLHQSFPGQFFEIACALGKNPQHEVVFLYQNRHRPDIPGVKAIPFQAGDKFTPTHPYVNSLQKAVVQGISVYRTAVDLKQRGFYPDIIIGHSGWGANLYVKDLFPNARLISYCEWFFYGKNSEVDFDPEKPVSEDLLCLTRTANASFLLDLTACDAALSPTIWQAQQMPSEYRYKQVVIHDGIDINVNTPDRETASSWVRHKLGISSEVELITYVGRGKDLYRGFPQFMEMAAILLRERPNAHVIIVGGDQVAYGPPPQGYASYKEMMLDRLSLDLSRVHFMGPLPKSEYRMILQASDVHVYLTYPFVLSWSLLEAMACGCLVIASDTEPVKEVIQDGVNGFLESFFSPGKFAEKVQIMLENKEKLLLIRQRARQTIVDRYGCHVVIPRQIQFFQDVWERKFPFKG